MYYSCHLTFNSYRLRHSWQYVYIRFYSLSNVYTVRVCNRSYVVVPDTLTPTSYRYGYSLRYCGGAMRGNKGVCLHAVEQDGYALEFAHESMQGKALTRLLLLSL